MRGSVRAVPSSSTMKICARAVLLPLVASLLACAAPTDDADDEAMEEGEALSGTPQALDIGFNGGPDQFDYWNDFFGAQTVKPGPRLCHTYLVWTVADEPAGAPDAKAKPGTRAWFEAWLGAAKGHCDEALISFQAHADGGAPSEKAFADALRKFLNTPWRARTGFAGAMAIAPWNEPNNGAHDGNGLGKPIEPERAARYFLSAAHLCASHGCTAVAGDFASNGNFWNDYEWNCRPGDVDANDPSRCRAPTPLAQGRGPSYLDRYKAVILNHADDKEYGLGKGFRPAAFAYHGWHDVNGYLATGDHCGDYGSCAVRRVLKNLGGSWAGVPIWDTEVGVGQFSDRAPSDEQQACAAAFLLRVHAKPSARIKRVYITRLHGGPGRLVESDHMARPAMLVLAKRESTYSGARCR